MTHLKVLKTASKGIVMGKAFVSEKVDLSPSNYAVTDKNAEIEKYTNAVAYVDTKLSALAETNEIFAGHVALLHDPALLMTITNKINDNNQNVEQALADTTTEFAMIFEMMDDEYMRERAADIKDVSNRVMTNIKGLKESNFADISEKVILVAEDLAPSDTATLNLDNILGFITELGGVTSHVSIMARSLSLPALVAAENLLSLVKSDDFIVMDAKEGDIFVNPDQATIEKYEALAVEFAKNEEELKKLADLDAVSTDGRKVKVYANVGSVTDIENAVAKSIKGVGLFRSEFLYMENDHFPTEEEQFAVYKKAAELCEEEVIIRTLDIGGDKGLPYFDFETEENPFLGYRALRISLDLVDVFKAQLRALLRASAFGPVKIMYPMVISTEEITRANDILTECKNELTAEGKAFNEKIKVGIMIETPASVMMSEEFAKHVDFFSIGTNDLTQYLLCVDRGNKKIASMYNSLHPAVLTAINRVIKAGHAQNIEVGMCGEFASDERACKVLLGMGLDEYSVSASEANNIKKIIRSTSFAECEDLAKKVCACSTLNEVASVLK